MSEKASDTKNRDRLILYHDFLWKINYSNHLFIKASCKDTNLRVYIGNGNNSNLIASLMKRRFWWTVTENVEASQFSWSQLRIDCITASQ